ncbi:MAG TPA: DUF3109 family protein [Bacteroidales bacterium]|nr:DUF3109 family protein [Bacteroidales bacterium]
MIHIGNTLVSLDVIEKKFVCNISMCKGICCVQGDAGAPITIEEMEEIEVCLPSVIDMLPPDSRELIDGSGIAVFDPEGELVTNTIDGSGACVFAIYDLQGNTICALEKAYAEGKTHFRKPISCHLYPIRIKVYKYYDAVNYHAWDICRDAPALGRETGTPVYVFLKDALIRKYGEAWYEELRLTAENYLATQ